MLVVEFVVDRIAIHTDIGVEYTFVDKQAAQIPVFFLNKPKNNNNKF
jgi:hypothetical protein